MAITSTASARSARARATTTVRSNLYEKENDVVKAVSFEVGFVYCNDVGFIHEHDNVKEATTEYAELLAQAIEPTPGENSEKVHLREVYLNCYDSDGGVDQISSGVFKCEHRD
jgi:hypothetical protein